MHDGFARGGVSAYNHTFGASGTQPISYSVASGMLPPGLALSPSGVLSGTPTTPGSYTVTVTANGSGGSASQSFTIVVNKALLMVKADNKSRALAAPNPSFTASYSGFVNGDTTTALSGAPSCSTTATQLSPIGMYPITCTAGALISAKYAFTFVPGTLTVTEQHIYLPIIQRVPAN